MTVEQIVDVPADYRIFIDLPRSIPTGVKARIEINVPATETNNRNGSVVPSSSKMEEVRQLLQKEMTEKGTSEITAVTGDGWESHVREHYAES
jgi:uncharacterized protein (DUF1501 family)